MTHWHADVDSLLFRSGAKLTVSSRHHVVSLATADTLSIAVDDAEALGAVVLDRTAAGMKIGLDDGRACRLRMIVDESLHPPGEGGSVFSRQVWLTLE
jgi:hypothetical protein